MAFTKIENSDLTGVGVIGLPDKPGLSTAAMQSKLEETSRSVVIPKHNALIDELQASTAAADLGAVAPTGRTGTSVQSVLNSISSDLGTAEAQSHSHPNKAVIDKFADDGTGITYDGNPVGAVTSVNSQTGAVVLTASDVGALPSTTAIPTKTSDLTNDSGFITASSLPTKTSQLTNDSGFITSGDIPTIPTKTSDLTNDSNFVADASYVHTDNNYDATAKAIVDGATAAIAAKSTVAWNQIDTTGTKIAEITIDGVKTEVKATGGGNADAYKTIDAGGQSFVASGADTFKINAGSNVTITPLTGDKGIQISAAGGGTSTGDMLASVYDNDFTIKNASPTGNGIKDYVASAISGKVDTAGDGLAKEGTTIALDLGMLTGSNLTKAVSGKDIKDALDEKADTSDIPTPVEKATWDAKVSESLLKSTVGWTGKNKFDNHQDFFVGFINTTNSKFVLQSNYYTGIVPVKPNTEYIITKEEGKTFRIALSTDKPANNVSFRYTEANHTGTEITVTTGANDNYLSILFWSSANGDTGTYQQMADTVMVRDASITDDTYEPYHESVEEVVEQIYADNGVLGAKNLLPNNATSQNVNGVTFTVNADGSITANGTSREIAYLTLTEHLDTSSLVGCLITGLPVENDSGIAYRIHTQSSYTSLKDFVKNNDILTDVGNDVCLSIRIGGNKTVNNLTFYPMLRLASDPDDTYVPYAMTNRELTEEKLSISELKTIASSAADFAAFKTAIANL